MKGLVFNDLRPAKRSNIIKIQSNCDLPTETSEEQTHYDIMFPMSNSHYIFFFCVCYLCINNNNNNNTQFLYSAY